MTWLDELRRQLGSKSLAIVAKELGVSKTLVSQVVNEKYPGNLKRVQGIVESVYLGDTVECPVLGLIPKHKCHEHQNTDHIGSTPQGIKLYKACRSGCPNSALKEQLKIPIRLSFEQGSHQDSARERIKPYDASVVCMRLERQARADSENSSGSFYRVYSELLRNELMALAMKYNKLAKKQ